ncbi:MAG: response regulator [Nitrospinae bacterium]|nr:response regulator [Nitrospinota bacterium]MBF0633939.1 response regulator [Nitrospinota bacterium]
MLENTISLVVDDSRTVRRIVASILNEDLRCKQVIQCENADEAMALILGGDVKVDWIFSGWELQGMSGYEFLEKVRKNPSTAMIPFVMMTSHDDRESILKALNAGVTDYLIKPFTHERFLEDVQRIFSLRFRRKHPRYRAKDANPVEIVFKDGYPYHGNLMDISVNDVLVRTTLFTKGMTQIYDKADLKISMPGGSVSLNGELFRMERMVSKDRTDMIYSAFEITKIDKASAARLERFIDGLREEISKM